VQIIRHLYRWVKSNIITRATEQIGEWWNVAPS